MQIIYPLTSEGFSTSGGHFNWPKAFQPLRSNTSTSLCDISTIKLRIPLCKGTETLTEGGVWLETKVALEGGGVGIGDRDITGLHGDKLLVGFEVVVLGKDAGTDEFFLQDGDEIQQILGLVVTYIIYGIGWDGETVFAGLLHRGFLHDTDNALDNVVDIGEVALAMAVVEDLDLFALDEFVGEAEIGHVGTTARTIDGEKTEARRGDVVELAVGMGHQFVALLSGGIEGDGIVDLVVGAVGHLLVAAIDAGGGGIDEMLYPTLVLFVTVAAGLEDVVEADEVGLDIGTGVGDAVAHTGLGGEVDHYLGLVLGKEAVNQLLVGNVAFDKGEVRVLRQLGEALFLETHVVVVVHIVDSHYQRVIVALVYGFNQVGADEAGSAGDKDGFHIC